MESKEVTLETVEQAKDHGQPRGQLAPPLTEHERQLERKLKWKLDLVILPLLATVYFLAQMVGGGVDFPIVLSSADRSSRAGRTWEMPKSQEWTKNLGSLPINIPMSAVSSTSAIWCFSSREPFWFEKLVLPDRSVSPSLYLQRPCDMSPLTDLPSQFAGAMIAWGVVTACTVVIHSYAELMVTRVFVGIAEAFVQGAVFYLSFWYPNNELATRGAIFFSTAALAGAFNGLIGYGVQKNLDGVNGWGAWRWIFLIEGVVPIGWAFVVFAFLPNTPETVKVLFTEEEKAVIIKRSRLAHNTGESKIRPKLILKVLIDPKFWMLVCIEGATLFCLNSLSNFLPAILRGFGWSVVKSQLMTVIVYAVAFVSIIFSARVSDKTGHRAAVLLANATIGAVGYILLIATTSTSSRFAGACIVAFGIYPNVVVNLTWAASMNVGYTFRASATALINSIAQAIAISGHQAYDDPPLYRHGQGASLGMLGLKIVLIIVLTFTLKYENKKKTRDLHSEKAEEMRNFTIDDIGNKHPDFFFKY